MDGLTDEEAAIVAVVRDFVDREVRPVVRELDHADTYPEALIERMKELGVFGLAVPQPWGETPVSAPCYVAITEELACGWMSLAGAMGGHTVVAKLIAGYGTRAQQDHYLPRMATGEIRATMALTEPGGGSDLQALRTTARRDGASYVVDGAKTWITNARRSQLVALLCKTDPGAEPAHAGISILLVEKGPGFRISRDLPKLGYKGVESCELSFVDFRAPETALLGGVEGQGFAQMMRGLEIGRIQVAARALGVGRAWRIPCATPRSGRRSAGRSGSTSPSATTSPTWPPNWRRPAGSCTTPPAVTTRESAPTSKPGWRSCSRRRRRWRSRCPRCASTAPTATPRSSTSSATSGTRR
jgi:alkylation response protein AidB-like acyl-CoA dehydrogenase